MGANTEKSESRQEVVNFPPYLASSLWYQLWLSEFAENGDDTAAIKEANRLTAENRELSRCRIRTPKEEIQILSMAIEGGGKQLKSNPDLENLLISPHGNPRKKHLQAIDAAYGKKPFYRHVADRLEPIFHDEKIITLKDFNMMLHKAIAGLLTENLSCQDLLAIKTHPIAMERGKELAVGVRNEISVIDVLMNLGQEAVFPLTVDR